MYSDNFSFRGWNLIDFIKGRKKLIIAGVGYIAGYLTTQNPMIAGIVAAGADVVYAVIEYYCKKY